MHMENDSVQLRTVRLVSLLPDLYLHKPGSGVLRLRQHPGDYCLLVTLSYIKHSSIMESQHSSSPLYRVELEAYNTRVKLVTRAFPTPSRSRLNLLIPRRTEHRDH